MRVIIALCLVAVAFGWEDIVAEVNKANAGWTAEVPTRFGNLEDVKTVCGTWMKGHPQWTDTNLPRHPDDISPKSPEAIPTDFDSRTQWPKCPVIATVRDQSACGSCWAFGSTETFEDRRCIAKGESMEFSTQDTAGCCKGFSCGFSMGCNGGQPSAALEWMTKTGVVTGGDYFNRSDASGGCKPYLLAPCAHHVPPTPKYPACPGEEYSISCKKDCSDSASGKSYNSDKTKGARASSYRTVSGMQTAIMNGGPLAVAFTVYSDFPTYKSGVYVHTSGSELGGHAVEMTGWGVENGTPYWWIKNSWNEQWGNGGFFKIKRGVNECGIESDVTGIDF